MPVVSRDTPAMPSSSLVTDVLLIVGVNGQELRVQPRADVATDLTASPTFDYSSYLSMYSLSIPTYSYSIPSFSYSAPTFSFSYSMPSYSFSMPTYTPSSSGSDSGSGINVNLPKSSKTSVKTIVGAVVGSVSGFIATLGGIWAWMKRRARRAVGKPGVPDMEQGKYTVGVIRPEEQVPFMGYAGEAERVPISHSHTGSTGLPPQVSDRYVKSSAVLTSCLTARITAIYPDALLVMHLVYHHMNQ